ncbi:MAG: RNB domain-containing ribonuclease [Treponema sp.]|nr:RNB domain-containing ribonuclease [Treponema sp.]
MTGFSAGALVLYKNRPALTGETAEKISLALSDGSSIKVRPKDIELLYSGPFKSLAELGEASMDIAAAARETLNHNQDAIRDAWELLSPEGGSGEKTTLAELASLVFGNTSMQSIWRSYALLADGLYFTGSAEEISARGGAEIVADKAKRGVKKNEADERGAFLQRLKSLSLKEGDIRFMQDVEALAEGKSEKSRTMRELGKNETPVDAHRFLLACGIWDYRVNPHPSRWGVSTSPPAQAPAADDDALPRRNFESLEAFAIDSPWSDDPDDAVSLETEGGKIILYVHVADPACGMGEEAAKEARSRGATLYLPEDTIRMLSDSYLSKYSLAGNASPALTFKMTIDTANPSFVEKTEIFPSTVRVTRLSYEEADAKQNEPVLAPLFALGQKNFERRLRLGAVNIDLPEVRVAAHDGGVLVTPVKTYHSSSMVRECMLLAGEGAAAWAAERRLPFPCVTQEAGDLPAKLLPGFAGGVQLRRCMRPRRVSVKPGPHWGLGLDAYTQVTSPLRRCLDLLAHLQIRAFLRAEQKLPHRILDGEQLLLHLAVADAAAARVVQAERASKTHWILVYLAQQMKDEKKTKWEAVVCEKGKNFTTMLIPDLAFETKTGVCAAEPGDTVTLSLGHVKIPEGEAVFLVK